MNNLIRVEDAKLYLAKNYIGGKKSLGQCLDEVPTVNAIVIPENPTNGDMIKALFPEAIKSNYIESFMDFEDYIEIYIGKYLMRVSYDWWIAPYKKGDVSE